MTMMTEFDNQFFESDARRAFEDMPPSVYLDIHDPVAAETADKLAKLPDWQRNVTIRHSNKYRY